MLLTRVATGVLVLHSQPIDHMAFLAAQGALGQDTAPSQLQLILASAGGMVVLAVVTVLSVYKPRGLVRSTAAVATAR